MCAYSVQQWEEKFLKKDRRRKHRKGLKRRLTRHHLLARSRGGRNTPNNLLLLWSDRHQALNKFFGATSTIDEQIEYLRLQAELFHRFFGKSVGSFDEAIAVLSRIKRAKKL